MDLVRADGATTPQTVEAPTTLRALLESADVRAFEFDYLDVVGDTTVRLTRAQALGEDVTVDGDDVRIGDVAKVRSIQLGEGSPLTVSGRADAVRVTAGDAVRFSAIVAGLEDGEVARVRWSFGDDRREEGTRVTHAFEAPGRYAVVVGAITKADRAGASDVVVVQVGAVAATPTATPAPTATPLPAATPAPAPAHAGTPGETRPPSKAVPTAIPTPAPPVRKPGRRVAGQLLGAPTGGSGGPTPPAASEPDHAGMAVPPGIVGSGAALLLAAAGFRLDMRRARPGWR